MNSEYGTVNQSELPHLKRLHRGKVRDVYEIDQHSLLFVTCDRLSAFDVVLPSPIPGKGVLLNQISQFWFDLTEKIIPNHLLGTDPAPVIGDHPDKQALIARSCVVKRLKGLPVEAIVRGYLAGSGWKDYQQSGMICGHKLATELNQAEKLPEPIFTPSTKAEVGEHDENIPISKMDELLGQELSQQVQQISLQLYQFASTYALKRGIIIADCKFEFGLDQDGKLVLMDELFTPDSSRFWPVDQYRTNISPPSFDKQFVRDYLETLDWDKTAPGPALPEKITRKTAYKYQEAYLRLSDQL